MTDRETHYGHILAHPADTLARLTYADRLEEEGEPERAEFIRVQCELAAAWARRPCPDCCSPDDDPDKGIRAGCRGDKCQLRFRENALLCDHHRAWFPHRGSLLIGRAVFEGFSATAFLIERGFVAEVRCNLAWWIDGEACCHGSDLVRRQPVARVIVTDREPAKHRPPTNKRRSPANRPFWSNNRSISELFLDWIPDAVFRLLPFEDEHQPEEKFSPTLGVRLSEIRRYYPTREAALQSLSEACITWAKEQPAP